MTGKYFPDQPIIPGADVIYPPGNRAGEYAPLATNPYKGCGHGCKYCYVPGATHQDRAEFNKGATPRPNFLPRLARDIERYRDAGITGDHPAAQIFITFSSDPFHLGDLEPTRQTLTMLRDRGLSFSTLTKGGTRSLPFLELYRRERDCYAASLTSLDDDFQQNWEPDAAPPADRIAALERFHRAGIFTWVSIEPTLDCDHSLAVIERVAPFVDLFKVGMANYLAKITRETDWRGYTLRVIDLLQKLGKAHYIKRDLQGQLPPNYYNPLRISQHH